MEQLPSRLIYWLIYKREKYLTIWSCNPFFVLFCITSYVYRSHFIKINNRQTCALNFVSFVLIKWTLFQRTFLSILHWFIFSCKNYRYFVVLTLVAIVLLNGQNGQRKWMFGAVHIASERSKITAVSVAFFVFVVARKHNGLVSSIFVLLPVRLLLLLAS